MSDRFELKAILSANAQSLIQGLKSVQAPAQAARKYLTDIGKSASGLAGKFGLPIGIVGGLAAGFGLAKVKDAVHAYAELGEAVHHGATRAGMSVEQFQRMKYVAEQNGVAVEQMEGAMGKLNLTLGRAASGRGKEAAALLTHLGIAMRDASGQLRSGMGVLPELADAFVRNENPAVRARMGMALFGKKWQEIVPLLEAGGEGIEQAQARMSRFKGVMNEEDIGRSREFAKSLRDLEIVSKGFQIIIAKNLVPAIKPLLDGFNDWMAANKKLVSTEVGRIAKDLGRGLSSIDWRGMARSVLALGHGIGKLVDFVGGPRNALIGLAVVMNAQTIMALGGLVAAVGRAGIALLGMAANAYVASNATVLSMLRMGLGASQLVTGPLALLRSGWTLLTTTTVSMSGLMSSAFALVAGGIRAVGAAMMANPLGILLAIASAAWLIVENWDTVKGWFNRFWNWIKAHAELILTCLGPIGWVASTIIEHWEPLKTWFGDFVHWLSDKLSWMVDAAKAVGHAFGIGSEDETTRNTAPNLPYPSTPFSALTPSVAGERPSLLGKAAGGAKVEGQVNIKIDGLPPGSRVEQVRGGTMPINVDAGYSAHALLMP
ncbi:phage tail tape measure protein [Xanthomonas albilineans]|uniref:phage tail tape measure protein n=1 Tax=Xanthomonas albilineans TaxID=29447 RepID=UPI0005F346C3|nr:phage tail tape measure protein [Xanthomonas albilineans]